MIWWIVVLGWLLMIGCGVASLLVGLLASQTTADLVVFTLPLSGVGFLILIAVWIVSQISHSLKGFPEDADFWRASGPYGPRFGMGAPPKPIDIMILSNLLYFSVSGILSWCRGSDGNLYHKNRAQLLYMAFQLFISFFGTVNLLNYAMSHNPFHTGWATYNYLVYAVMNSNHFNTGMSLFIDITIGGGGSEDAIIAATVAFLVCTCGLPLAALVTHTLFAVLVYCWLFAGLAGIAFVLLHAKNQSSDLQDVHFSESFRGYKLKFGLTIFLTFVLQWLPTCAVWFYLGEASKDYLQPIFTTSSQLFDHKPWLDSVKLAMSNYIPGLHHVLHLVSTLTLGDADVSDVWKDISRNSTDVSETIAFMDLLNTF